MAHYPQVKIKLSNSDKLLVRYVGNMAKFGASTFKRLFGWETTKQYIGIVVGDSVEFSDCENGKHCFTHWLYNIECGITIGQIQLLQHSKPTIQLQLFE